MEVIIGALVIGTGFQVAWVYVYAVQWWLYKTDAMYRVMHGKPHFWLWNQLRNE